MSEAPRPEGEGRSMSARESKRRKADDARRETEGGLVSNPGSGRDHRTFGNYGDTIPDPVPLALEIPPLLLFSDHHVIPDAGVLVDYGPLDGTVLADPHRRLPPAIFALPGQQLFAFIEVLAKKHDLPERRAAADDTADAYDRIDHAGVAYGDAFREQAVPNLRADDTARGRERVRVWIGQRGT